MAGAISQTGRIGKLTTSAGEDVFGLERIEAEEALSELFEFRIGAISEQANFNFNSLLGKNACVTLETVDGLKRVFNGVLIEAKWTGARYDLSTYQMVLRPWLWLLSRGSDSRIFANMKTPDILKQVFNDRGFSDVRDALTGSYPTLEYTVQYRETDLNFVCRLMEEYGIYYFFEHSEDKHTLVLADSPTAHKPAPGLASVPFLPEVDAMRRDEQQIESWTSSRGLQTGVYTLNDYNYDKPSADLVGKDSEPGSYAHGSIEMYNYPGGYDDKDVGTQLAKVREQAEQAKDDRRSAAGAAPSLFPGVKMTLAQHPNGSENQEYLVLRARHSYHDQSYVSGQLEPSTYSGGYELMEASRQFRAPWLAQKGIVHGPHSALVVGKQGEEIDVDDQGRILVQFYWDRKKKPSRRVRVAQIWAGKTRGALFLPRIGDEVLIDYEDGDPDRPIVIGSVYNGNNKVPTPLPDDKVHSGILTKSSKGGDGYHMLLFDDTAGSEKIKLRSQKDLMFKALNDEQRDIGHNQTETVGGDETINVGSATGGGNFTLNAFQTITLNVGPIGAPLTQIAMTQESITLSVGPEGLMSQIAMTQSGITLSVMGGLTSIAMTPASVATMSPTISETAMAAITLMAPAVTVGAVLTTPMLVAGAGTASGLPLL